MDLDALTTRFAPSPTGLLHLGHAYAALIAYDLAKVKGGRFLLRIEDIDAGRCRREFENAIFEDLVWLGLEWETPVRRQSEHLDLYREKLEALKARGVVYPCFCTRKEIAEEIARMGSAPQGPEGAPYPGTCRRLSADEREARIASGEPHTLRLWVEAAAAALDPHRPLTFTETGRGSRGEHGQVPADLFLFGDIVLGRKDVGVSYHLAVTVDDHFQGVTMVTRGEDLFPATHVQRLLQELLGFSSPRYYHHPLIRHESGRKLAKRDKDETLKALRHKGATALDVRRHLGVTNPEGPQSS